MHVIGITSDYQRWILSKVRQFPLALMWIARAAPDFDCPNRRRACHDLLTDPRSRDDSSLKIKALFCAELETASSTGK
eukprot:1146407-Alexandrium_andersonii.AAC.1